MSAIAISEDGNVLAEHCCSHEVFMAHDLGIVGTWKHEHYDKHHGKGNWELVWISDVKGDVRLQAAIELNSKLPQTIPDDVRAGITMTFGDGSKSELHPS